MDYINNSFNDTNFELSNSNLDMDAIKSSLNYINNTLMNYSGPSCDICLGPEDNLQEIINSSRNKTICLEKGIYNENILIGSNSTDLVIKSLDKWGAIFDGGNSDYCIKIDNAKNISIRDILTVNGKSAFVITNNSETCQIENNQLLFFGVDGIFIDNSTCSIYNNKIMSDRNHRSCGISINNSNGSQISYNDISVKGYLIYLDNNSCNNKIKLLNNGRICEKGIDNLIDINDVQCGNKIDCNITDSSFKCWCKLINNSYLRLNISEFSCNEWC